MQTDRFRSKMHNARGLGASGHGVKHWWLQRITALALIPLSIWFVVSLLSAMMFPTPELVAEWLASPINALALSLMIVALFVHAWLGVQVIIEDYVKCPMTKYGALIAVHFVSFGLGALSILSILRLHFIDLGGAL